MKLLKSISIASNFVGLSLSVLCGSRTIEVSGLDPQSHHQYQMLKHRILLTANSVNIVDSKYPAFRYIPWIHLDQDVRDQATSLLGYTQETWDNPGTASVEQKIFDDLNGTEKQFAAKLGFDDDTWDCYMNHYNKYTWQNLHDAGVEYYFKLLGYTESNWDDGNESDLGDDKNGGRRQQQHIKWEVDWNELNAAQQTAAKQVCYQQETWDELDLNDWHCTHDYYKEKTWDQLQQIGVQPYLITLGFSQQSWDQLGYEDLEISAELWTDNEWDKLTSEEKIAIIHLCYYKDSRTTSSNNLTFKKNEKKNVGIVIGCTVAIFAVATGCFVVAAASTSRMENRCFYTYSSSADDDSTTVVTFEPNENAIAS